MEAEGSKVIERRSKNPSETLFEEYLMSHGHSDWHYEVDTGGKRLGKRPDYRLTDHGAFHYFEVKEFAVPTLTLMTDSYDLYKPIRKKIDRAAGQFKNCQEFSCSLVLSNLNCAIVRLEIPLVVIASMLGDLAFQVPVRGPLAEGDPGRTIFTDRGKMVNYKRREPQNTTVSSVIVLGTYSAFDKQIEEASRQRRQLLDRKMTLDESVKEALELIQEIGNDRGERVVRVVVYENPFARIPLSRDLFQGPFDERWGLDGQFMRRIFIGTEILRSDASRL
jgi:hypothetical protein